MAGCAFLERLRDSVWLVVLVVFCALLTDSLLLTLVDPILPDILLHIDLLNGNYLVTELIGNETVSDLVNDNGRYGFLVAAKGGAQFLVNPFVGSVVNKFGYRAPMMCGSVLLMLSTLVFAFGNSYAVLFTSRIVQGISSSFTAVTGLGLLASTFSDDGQRGKAMGIGLSGLSVGIIVGPVYGSVLYEFFGQPLPFVIVASMIAVAVLIMVISYKEEKIVKDVSYKSVLQLWTDPYILIVAGNIFVLNLDVAVILGFLPLRLIDLQHPATWKLGVVVLPTSVGYLFATLIFSRTTKCLPRWCCSFLGLMISAASLIALAFCYTFELMLTVTTFLGLALGMVSVSAQPLFAHLVDIRHENAYGNVYALSDMSICLAMTLGPLLGGPLYYAIGFDGLVYCCAGLNSVFFPLCVFLRDPPGRKSLDENSKLLVDSSDGSEIHRKYAHFWSSTEVTPEKRKDVNSNLSETI